MSFKPQVMEKFNEGVLYRTAIICFGYAFTFSFFGVYSYPFIKKFIPDLQLYQNLIPRVFLSSIPLLILGVVLKNRKISHNFRLNLWILSYPCIMHAASWIFIWPLLLKGETEVFYFVNATNIFSISLWYIFAAPSIRDSLKMIVSYTLIFYVPLGYIIFKLPNSVPFNIFLNDSALASILSIIAASTIAKLRLKLAVEDVDSKENVRSFLGKDVADAIFEQKELSFKDVVAEGFLVSIDLRGYTQFFNKRSEEVVREFLIEYHKVVAEAFITRGGFIHKTAGDGHLISFGLTDTTDILKSIAARELNSANKEINSFISLKISESFEALFQSFEKLKLKYSLEEELSIGAGIDYGKIELKLVGDIKLRKERDLFGMPVIRVSRLESFTKTLMISRKLTNMLGMYVISPEASKYFQLDRFDKIETNNLIKDFPNVHFVYAYLKSNASRQNLAA